jgi:hypothetical protein
MVKWSGRNGWGITPRRAISEMQFWLKNLGYNTQYGFRLRPVQALLTTDSSERGWEAVLVVGSMSDTTYDCFSTKYAYASSNLRETTAVLKALLFFKEALVGMGVNSLAIKTDNMVTVFKLLTKWDIRISVTHIPGTENTVEDALSRMDPVGDYQLERGLFERGLRALGVAPTVDLFANCNNAKCPSFVALPGKHAEGARALDAMRYDWRGKVPYLSPPVQMIPRVLQKVAMEHITAVMVLPEWPSQPWWNLMRCMAVAQVRSGKSKVALKPGPYD